MRGLQSRGLLILVLPFAVVMGGAASSGSVNSHLTAQQNWSSQLNLQEEIITGPVFSLREQDVDTTGPILPGRKPNATFHHTHDISHRMYKSSAVEILPYTLQTLRGLETTETAKYANALRTIEKLEPISVTRGTNWVQKGVVSSQLLRRRLTNAVVAPMDEKSKTQQVVTNLLRSSLDHIPNVIISHDNSEDAQQILQNYLTSENKRPVLINMIPVHYINNERPHFDELRKSSTVGSVEATSSSPEIQATNTSNKDDSAKEGSFEEGSSYLSVKEYATQSTVFLLMYKDPAGVKAFLSSLEPGWFPVSVILLGLDTTVDFRPLLTTMSRLRNAPLVQVTRQGKGGDVLLQVTTHKPFAPPGDQFITQTFDVQVGLNTSELFPDRFQDFHDHHFQLASWIDDFPFLYYGQNGTVMGLGPTMLHEIAQRLHFTYELFDLPVDGFWGELVNGTWLGMIGELVRNEKDFIINGFSVVLDRYQAVDISTPYLTDSFSFVIKVPPPVPRWIAVVYPFDWRTWAGLFAVLCTAGLAFHFLVRTVRSPVYSHSADVVSSILWLLRAVLGQSVPVIPSSLGTRPFLLCWWLASLVISTSYVGNLVAFLTVPGQAQKMHTLEELASSNLKCNMLDYGNYVPGALRSSNDPVLRQLGFKLEMVDTYQEAIENIQEGSHALLEATLYLQYYMALKKQSNVYFLDEELYSNYQSWMFPKGTPWKHKIDEYLSRMTQSGLLIYWTRKNLQDFRTSMGLQGVTTEQELLRPLNLEELQGAFLILAIGIIAAVLVLCIELMIMEVQGEKN